MKFFYYCNNIMPFNTVHFLSFTLFLFNKVFLQFLNKMFCMLRRFLGSVLSTGKKSDKECAAEYNFLK